MLCPMRPTVHLSSWIVCLILLTGTASAQSSRTEAIANQQAERADTVAAEETSRAEILLNRWVLPQDPDGLYPFFASPFPGGSFPIGVGYQRHLGRGMRLGGGASWTIANYKLLQGHWGMPLDRDGKTRVDVIGRWIDAPSVAFYGLGPDTTSDDRADFGYRPSNVTAVLRTRPLPWVRLEAGYALQNAATTDDEEVEEHFTPDESPGLGQDLSYNVYGGAAALDTRPSPAYADHGSLLRAEWRRYSERSDKPFSFDETEVEAVQLVPLVGRFFILAFHGLATFTDTRDGNTVPFMLAPHVGSGSTLRGFRNRRFQDRHRVVLNAEYRWQASRYLNMAIFYDAGQVQPDKDRFRWREFETSYGIGARFHTPMANVLRLEIARSREGWVLVGGTTQSF